MRIKALTALLLSAGVVAQAAPDFNVDDYNNPDREYNEGNRLLEVPITDTRGTKTNTASVSSTTYLNKEDIQRSGARNVDQLMQQIPGMQFSRTGGPGGVTSFYLRGAEPDTTLVLLNDVRIQSINTGFSLISELPLSSIESIEIIRGPQSALYGSAAPGGVIKIYTTPGTQGANLALSTGASDQGDLQTSLSGGTEVNDTFVFGSGNWTSRNGIDACRVNSACFVAEPETDLDGLEQLNGQIGMQMFGDEGQSLQLSHLYNNSRQEFDGDFSNESESTQKVTNAQVHQPLTRHQKIRFDLGQFDEFYESIIDSDGTQTPVDQYGTERYTSSLVHEASLLPYSDNNALTLISGIDYDHSTLVDSSVFPKINRQSTGAFSEIEYYENGATFRLGVRRDMYVEDHSEFAEDQRNYATTGHFKIKFDINSNWALKTGLGRNFNMPTFSELYYPGFSNPNLAPESHTSQDLGIEYVGDQYQASLFVYRTKSKDLIVYGATGPESIGEALLKGMEFAQGYRLDNFELGGSITYLDAVNTTQGAAQNELPRRPKAQFAGHMAYQYNQTRARLGVLTVGNRFDDLSNTIEVGGYSIFDTSLTYQASQNLNLGVRIENLLDKDYQTVFGYNQPDRSIWFDIDYMI